MKKLLLEDSEYLNNGGYTVKRLLLVEDDPKLNMALSVRLKSMGYAVTTAVDAIMAVSEARKSDPDVIVIDINMPGGDGFKVIERIQAINEIESPPFVVITASKKPGLRQRAEELGAIAFLEKPFDVDELKGVIERSSIS